MGYEGLKHGEAEAHYNDMVTEKGYGKNEAGKREQKERK